MKGRYQSREEAGRQMEMEGATVRALQQISTAKPVHRITSKSRNDYQPFPLLSLLEVYRCKDILCVYIHSFYLQCTMQ